MSVTTEQQLRAYVDYLRDMGVYDLYRRDEPAVLLPEAVRERLLKSSALPGVTLDAIGSRPATTSAAPPPTRNVPAGRHVSAAPPVQDFTFASPLTTTDTEPFSTMPKPRPIDELIPLPAQRIPAAGRALALDALHAEIGDCTRCPLAYAGRRKIVFGDGDPNARLMFVGEGPGADEDETGVPFVGKAGQLLNNMITAMGLRREDVYIANIVKCRPPANRTPEYVEATTCSPFLAQQIDIVQPEVIVALGATAATYLLGVKQSLASLRGQWLSARGAKVAVTYHPAFLLRDPRQKGEAWKDLQRVMAEMGLKPPSRPS
jgi:uracil-DNA glycosylase family 4